MRLWRRHLAAVLIGVIGLACAFAVSMLAGFYIYDGVRSDAWLEGAGSLYRVENQWLPGGQVGVFGRTATAAHDAKAVIEANMPELGPLARLVNLDAAALKGEAALPTRLSFADPGFETLIPLPMVRGSLGAIHTTKNAIALSESEALRLLGSHELGQTISFRLEKQVFDFQLVAIFRDIPSNSHMKLGALASWNEPVFQAALGDDFQWNYAHTYFRMPAGANVPEIADRITNDMSHLVAIPWGKTINSMTIQPVLGVLARSDAYSDMRAPLALSALRVLAIIGALLLIVASFNFVNLFTGLNLARAREVAMRRIAGAGRSHLIAVFLMEAGVMSLIAFGLAVLIAMDTAGYAGELIGSDIPVIAENRLPLFAFGLLLALGVGLLAALYAVSRVSRITPQSLLHGTQRAVMSAGGKLRASLVGVQALAVVGCLLAASQALYQFDHLMTMDRGMRTNGVLIIPAPEDRDQRPLFSNSFFNEVKSIPGVTDAARQDDPAFSGAFYVTGFIPRGESETVETSIRLVGPNFFDMMNITPIARSGEDWHGLQDVIAIPHASLQTFGFATPEEAIDQYLRRQVTRKGEKTIIEYRIMAVVADIKDMGGTGGGTGGGAKAKLFNLSAYDGDSYARNIMLLAKDNDPAVEARVRELWATSFPDEAPRAEWLSDRIAKHYGNVAQMGEAILIMAGLCLLLCFAGLYGMASHFTSNRAREIALRRVLGAESRDVGMLFLRKMLLPVGFGALLALVPTWYLLGIWLQEIEEQAPLPVIYFAGIPAAVLLVAAMILAGQLRHVLGLRPAEVLHHE